MLSVSHFNAMIEQINEEHAITLSARCAKSDNYIYALCQLHQLATFWGKNIDEDVNSEPWCKIREICISNLRSYYEDNE